MARKTDHIYWALLREPIDEAKIKRVGFALIYPHTYDRSDKEYSEFEIV